ncbi:MAG TPA: TerB family tellurite resistance protein [Chryseolinea sp.]
MIGFFEHQYLSYKKNHIKNLLALAKADGSMHPKEESLLYKIGKRYGLKDRQVKTLIETDEKYDIVIPDNHNDKMNLLYDLILMVYADDVVDKHEIEFCEQAVKQFGMKKQLVSWLLAEFERGTPPPPDEWDEIKKEAKEKFVEKK